MEWFPYSKHKRYLTGIDWLMCAFDHQAKKAGLKGNYSQVVLELSTPPDPVALKVKLFEFLRRHPMLDGAVARDANLCPYWKVHSGRAKIDFHVAEAADDTRAKEALYAYINEAFAPQTYLAFYLVNSEARSFFAMKFDHRLFDARGAEMFLARFETYCQTGDLPAVQTQRTPGLKGWMKKFASGKKVNRLMLELRRGAPPMTLKFPRTKNTIEFLSIQFPFTDSRIIEEKSEAIAGHMMLMPYLLAITVKSFNDVFFRGQDKEMFVPVNIDQREKGVEDELFFNHLSFLFFRFSEKELEDIKLLTAAIKQRWFDQVKNGIPQAVDDASMLTRIASLDFTVNKLAKAFGAGMAAFSFACLNETAYSHKTFFQSKVNNVSHLPVVPPVPGVGIFFTRYESNLNLTISYLSGAMTPEQAQRLYENMKQTL